MVGSVGNTSPARGRARTPAYTAVPDESIKQLGSILTIVGGRIVHDAGVLRVR
jgi:hypothetical protein